MTEWEAGQILVELSDKLAEATFDLKKGGFDEQAMASETAMHFIGDVFNRRHSGASHAFGLKDSKSGFQPVEKHAKV